MADGDNSPLAARLAVEALAAIASAFSVAPAISIVDKAIVSNASGLEPLVPSVINSVKGLIKNPVQFFRQPAFLLIWGVYSGTYIVANGIQAFYERKGESAQFPKFVGSSVANVSLSVMKDKAFARMFGTGEAKPLPFRSYGLFATRDSLTVLASFTLPEVVAKGVEQTTGVSKKTAETAAQLITPCSMQILSTPLHLHGLDLYNRGSATVSERLSFVKREYTKTVLARMARIFPAFGVGGVINKQARASGVGVLKDMYA